MEILHLLRLPGVPHVEKGVEEEEEEEQGVETDEEESVEDGKCDEKADGGRTGAWEREKDVNEMEEKRRGKCDRLCLGRCRGRREEEG